MSWSFSPQHSENGKNSTPIHASSFAKSWKERCENLHVPSAKLRDSKNRYKIKLRSIGYRLVYEVVDGELIVLVIAVGKRDHSEIYERARSR